jgi:hypothetical protein
MKLTNGNDFKALFIPVRMTCRAPFRLIHSPMRLSKVTCIVFFLFASLSAFGQESEIKASSATDSKVKVHTGKRVRATSPPKKFRPRYRDSNKKAVNVKEKPPKVETNPKRKQKKRNKQRIRS